MPKQANTSVTRKNTIKALLILMSALGVFPLDVILPSAPALSKHFEVNLSDISATIALFTMIVAISQIIIGPLSDRFGRKPIFIGCIALAAYGAWQCTLAESASEFYAFRFLQALGCGGFVLAQAFVQDLFTVEERIQQRILLTSVSGIFISVSPTLGVFLENHMGWQGSFYTFSAIAVMVMIIGLAVLPAKGAPKLSEGSIEKLNAPSILRFLSAGIITTIAFASHFSFIVLSPVIFLEQLEMSLEQYGVIMLIYGVAYVAGGFIARALIKRISQSSQMIFGLMLIAIGGLVMAALHTFWTMNAGTVIGCMIIATCGVTLARPAATNLAMEALPGRAGTAASGLNTLTFIGGGAISLALGLYASMAQWLLPIALIVMALIGLGLCISRPIQTGESAAGLKL